MSSYGDDLRCKDVHASGVVEAQTLTVKAGGNFAGGGAYKTAKPGNHDATSPVVPTPGAVGDIVFVNSSTPTDNGVWACTTGGASFAWTHIADK